MTTKKSGFAGLGDLVSDISDMDSVPEPDKAGPPKRPSVAAQGGAQAVATPTQPEREVPAPAPAPAPQAAPARQSAGGTTADAVRPEGGGNGMWWLIGISLFIVFAIAISSGGNGESRSSSVSSAQEPAVPRKPTLSQSEQAIEPASPDAERLLEKMLADARSSDFVAAGNAAAAIEKLVKPSSQGAKPQTKEARAQNALGLKALKEARKEAAVQNFLAAYKANPRDTEIANNFGDALYGTGDFTAASKAYLASLALTPKRPYAWMGLGKLYARGGDPAKAASAFGLAVHFAKSPRQLRQSVVTLFREDENYAVKTAAKAFLVQNYSAAVPDFLRPVLANLSDVAIPVFLPAKVVAKVVAKDGESNEMPLIVVNNEEYGIEATPESYKIPLASEPDCRASYCIVGALMGRKVAASEPMPDGEPAEITGGIVGRILRNEQRESSWFVFRVGGVQYLFAVSGNSADDVAAANSALRLGSIPVDAFSGQAKMARSAAVEAPVAPPPQAYVPPTQAPVRTYSPPPAVNPSYCDIDYSVSLQTFGEGVSVELRQGTPGNSRPVKTAYSSGGTVRFSSLCPGSYFLAIGNGESVSVTPTRSFETGRDYTSTLTMQRGSGNVSNRRKSDL